MRKGRTVGLVSSMFQPAVLYFPAGIRRDDPRVQPFISTFSLLFSSWALCPADIVHGSNVMLTAGQGSPRKEKEREGNG